MVKRVLKLVEETKSKKITIMGEKDPRSEVFKFRQKMLKKGYDLVNITSLCEAKIGCSGWGNDINEADEKIFHIQIWYRDEPIANIYPNHPVYILDEKRFTAIEWQEDFVIFRKVNL